MNQEMKILRGVRWFTQNSSIAIIILIIKQGEWIQNKAEGRKVPGTEKTQVWNRNLMIDQIFSNKCLISIYLSTKCKLKTSCSKQKPKGSITREQIFAKYSTLPVLMIGSCQPPLKMIVQEKIPKGLETIMRLKIQWINSL